MKKIISFCKNDILGIVSICDSIRVWLKVDDIFQNIFLKKINATVIPIALPKYLGNVTYETCIHCS